MSKYKDFGSPVNLDNSEPIKFKIYDEEFECNPHIQGKTILEFASMSESDSSDAASAILDFFSKVMKSESHERFTALAEDPKRIVPVETLTEIIQWLVEEYTNRPTEGSEHS